MISARDVKGVIPKRGGSTAMEPIRTHDIWYDFDRMFDDFRSGMHSLMTDRWEPWPAMPRIETRVPAVDLQDRGKDYRLTAELPGFKKEDVDIQVTDDSMEIRASVGWKYDEKTEDYICAERRCDSFYRMVALPEKIKPDDIQADLKDGVLEVTLPKKEPKEKKKIRLK